MIEPGFTLDRFQTEAIEAIDAGRSVLVAAPTGAGKTVVAEHAVTRAIASGRKAFYTTPIKALSNQKYHDLVALHGVDRVGLLTGDNAIHGDASVVVMTTEVLRNMVYARSRALDELDFVILDEVHYLQDAYRGPVWEEVIIHLPRSVKLVCLSATVSNAGDLADWISTVRGPTDTVIETKRPVDLLNHYLVSDKHSPELLLIPTLVDGKPNPNGHKLDADTVNLPRHLQHRGRSARRYGTPRRLEVVERLAEEDLLPAIYFIFSRKGCDEAARMVFESGVRLTTAEERVEIRAIVEQRTMALSDRDLDLLDYDRWLAALELGIAAHHAGMVPPFKEAVEACFVEGLVKVVFATETLALGINMPARSVVIESLSKFTGERHENLTPATYTQLTGRAGRRGIDPIGHAIVLWSPFVAFDQVAGLAASREFALTSAFRPTYNMAANLVRRYDREEALRLLNLSFAQYEADKSVVKLESRRAARLTRIAELQPDAHCDLGDAVEYRQLLAEADRDERQAEERQRPIRLLESADAEDGKIREAVSRLQPGDVIRHRGHRLAVLSVGFRRGGKIKVAVVDSKAGAEVLGLSNFTQPPERVGVISLRKPFHPDDPNYLQKVASDLGKARLKKHSKHSSAERQGKGGGKASHQRDGGYRSPLRKARAHPVAACPMAGEHIWALEQIERLDREVRNLDERVQGRTATISRRFEKILDLLERWGYLDGWTLTARGEILARTYHESDLLVAEALASGLLDDLDPPALAGMASCLSYEHRSKEAPPPPWFPAGPTRARADTLHALALELNAEERAAGIAETRLPEPSFFALAHAWASGQELDDVLDDQDLSGGDFVRNIKQLIDLLRQIGDHAPVAATAANARAAAEALHRGIVAASSVTASGEEVELAADEDS